LQKQHTKLLIQKIVRTLKWAFGWLPQTQIRKIQSLEDKYIDLIISSDGSTSDENERMEMSDLTAGKLLPKTS